MQMNAVRFHDYGGPEVLHYEQAPRPEVRAGEILIRVHAAGVNPLDWKLRSGFHQIEPDQTFPVIPGFDVAGVVEALGPGVTQFSPGDEVYGSPEFGGYAEMVAVPAARAAHKPRALDYVQAAAMPIAAVTAWQSLFDVAQLAAGQTLLVQGAAGGVGHLAVQLAKWRGAQVIGTASSRNLDFLRRLGVDKPVDYTTTRFEDVVHDVDVVLDCVGGETQQRSWVVLKPGGILLSLAYPPLPPPPGYNVRHCAFRIKQPMQTTLAALVQAIDTGHLQPAIAAILPLSEARRAHEWIESRHTRGKIVLQVTP